MAAKQTLCLRERVFRGFLVFFLVLTPYVGYLVLKFQSSQAAIDHGHVFAFSDLQVIAFAFLIEHVTTLIQLMRHFIRGKSSFFLSIVDDAKYPNLEDRILKAKDLSIKAGNLIHYFCMCVFYYLAFYDKDNLPKCMGGFSNCDALLEKFPLPSSSLEIPHLKTYYLLQLGANIYKLLYQSFFNTDEMTYYEFTLHHFLTTFLIGFSYLIHALKMGSFIMLIHDISDLTFLFSRIYYETKGKIVAIMIPVNLLSVVSWIYARHYVLPLCALKTLCFGKHWEEDYPYVNDFFYVLWLEILMLSMLFIMHCVWTTLIFTSLFKMYRRMLSKKNK